jgi:hypothetical protein
LLQGRDNPTKQVHRGVLGIFCGKLVRYLSRNTLVPDIQTKSLPINIAHYNDFDVQVSLLEIVMI